MVVVIALIAGAVVGGTVALLARRWPAIAAPRVSAPQIAEKVDDHPKVAGHLRRHFDPKTETGVALTIATVAVGAAAVGIGLVVAMIRSKTGLERYDIRLAQFGADHATQWSTNVMRDISRLGGTPVVVLLALIATTIEMIRRPSRWLPVFMALVIGGQFALSNGIKYLVERARPDISRLTGFAGTSFPSGHSTAAVGDVRCDRVDLHPQQVASAPRSPGHRSQQASRGRGIDSCVPRRALVHRCACWLMLGWGWFAICSIAFGGRFLTFGQPVATAEVVADVSPAAPSCRNGRVGQRRSGCRRPITMGG